MKKMVLGAGNLLLSDEGVGIHVLQELQKNEIPQDTEIFDCGTAGWYALPHTEQVEKLIVVDAVNGRKKPGTVYRIIVDNAFEHVMPYGISLHEIGLFESLSWLNPKPKEIIVFGIQPQKIDWGMELSNEVNSKVPDIVKLVLREL